VAAFIFVSPLLLNNGLRHLDHHLTSKYPRPKRGRGRFAPSPGQWIPRLSRWRRIQENHLCPRKGRTHLIACFLKRIGLAFSLDKLGTRGHLIFRLIEINQLATWALRCSSKIFPSY
jgi:hypothetical protein